MVLGLPLRQGELGLFGVQVVDGSRIVAGRGQDLLELEHVSPWSPGAKERKNGTVPCSAMASRPLMANITRRHSSCCRWSNSTALTIPCVAAVTLRICLRASVPFSATVSCKVRVCTLEKMITGP